MPWPPRIENGIASLPPCTSGPSDRLIAPPDPPCPGRAMFGGVIDRSVIWANGLDDCVSRRKLRAARALLVSSSVWRGGAVTAEGDSGVGIDGSGGAGGTSSNGAGASSSGVAGAGASTGGGFAPCSACGTEVPCSPAEPAWPNTISTVGGSGEPGAPFGVIR